MIATIMRTARRVTLTRTVFAWVIEDANSHPSRPLYWSGYHEWDQDHMKAIRFSRRIDAIRLARSVFCENDYRVCEHGWEE
jgi:hypothetical protein